MRIRREGDQVILEPIEDDWTGFPHLSDDLADHVLAAPTKIFPNGATGPRPALMRYLVDTNAVIALLKRQPDVTARVMRDGRRDHGRSAIVTHELYFGAYRSDRPDETLAVLNGLWMPLIDFTIEGGRRAGEIRDALAAAGTTIGPCDVLIAGQAMARDLVLVSRSLRELHRVPGLKVENREATAV